jgi:hypothetical protein
MIRSFILAFLLDSKRYAFLPVLAENKRNIVIVSCVSSKKELLNDYWRPLKISDGFDARFNETDVVNNTFLSTIRINYKKMALLKTLENPNLSNMTKLSYIEDYIRPNEPTVSSLNIKAGGLFKDWESI